MREPATMNGGLPKARWTTSWIFPATGAGGGGGGGAGVVLGGAGAGAGVVGVAAPAASDGTAKTAASAAEIRAKRSVLIARMLSAGSDVSRAADLALRACAHAARRQVLIRTARERVR
jgi:hypothetical protein